MKLSSDELRTIAAAWRTARRLYPVYLAISHRFELGLGPCSELESPIDRSSDEVLGRVRAWLIAADLIITVHQLRMWCQTSADATDVTLRALVLHHLGKSEHTDTDRDKIDFLLVQYFAQCAGAALHRDDVRLHEVAQVLAPIFGENETEPPQSIAALDTASSQLCGCRSLREMLHCGVLYEVRRMKIAAGDHYFSPGVLIAFARYNFVARRKFFSLMRADVDALRGALSALYARGVRAIDCTDAGLSATESVSALEEICNDWKQPFHAEYASGMGFEQLARLREAAEAALKKLPAKAVAPVQPEPEPKPKPVAARPPVVEAAPAPEPPVNPAAKLRHRAEQSLHVLKQQLGTQMRNVNCDQKTATRLFIGGQKLMLSSWEVRAFVAAHEQFADALQSGVASRILLEIEAERARTGNPGALPGVLDVARAQAAALQEQVAQARDAHDIDAAVTLAATSKRLLQLIEETVSLVPAARGAGA